MAGRSGDGRQRAGGGRAADRVARRRPGLPGPADPGLPGVVLIESALRHPALSDPAVTGFAPTSPVRPASDHAAARTKAAATWPEPAGTAAATGAQVSLTPAPWPPAGAAAAATDAAGRRPAGGQERFRHRCRTCRLAKTPGTGPLAGAAECTAPFPPFAAAVPVLLGGRFSGGGAGGPAGCVSAPRPRAASAARLPAPSGPAAAVPAATSAAAPVRDRCRRRRPAGLPPRPRRPRRRRRRPRPGPPPGPGCAAPTGPRGRRRTARPRPRPRPSVFARAVARLQVDLGALVEPIMP